MPRSRIFHLFREVAITTKVANSRPMNGALPAMAPFLDCMVLFQGSSRLTTSQGY